MSFTSYSSYGEPLDSIEIDICEILATRFPFGYQEISHAYVLVRSFDLLIKALPLAAESNRLPFTVAMELKEFEVLTKKPFDGDSWAELATRIYAHKLDEEYLEAYRVIR